MKQWKFKMKKLCSAKYLKLWLENRPAGSSQCISEKSYLHSSILTLTKSKYFVLHSKVTLLTRRCSEQEIFYKEVLERF